MKTALIIFIALPILAMGAWGLIKDTLWAAKNGKWAVVLIIAVLFGLGMLSGARANGHDANKDIRAFYSNDLRYQDAGITMEQYGDDAIMNVFLATVYAHRTAHYVQDRATWGETGCSIGSGTYDSMHRKIRQHIIEETDNWITELIFMVDEYCNDQTGFSMTFGHQISQN